MSNPGDGTTEVEDTANKVAMWQTYVQTAENTSNRREAINRYMVPTHLAVLSAHWLLKLSDFDHLLIGVVGFGVGGLWIVLLRAHSKINEVKYDIIRKMESELPFVRSIRRLKPAVLILSASIQHWRRHR